LIPILALAQKNKMDSGVRRNDGMRRLHRSTEPV
jgi:hypothetical protein